MKSKKKEPKIKDIHPKDIPEFSSYAEEAEFWDTHSVAAYWDELEPAKITVPEDGINHLYRIAEGLTVPFEVYEKNPEKYRELSAYLKSKNKKFSGDEAQKDVTFTLRIPSSLKATIMEMAEFNNISPTSLARMWLTKMARAERPSYIAERTEFNYDPHGE